MQLRLSEQAAEQMYGKKEKKPSTGVTSDEAREAHQKRREQKAAIKRTKVEAREAALAADAALQNSFTGICEVEESIQKAENRLEKDTEEHRVRVKRAQGRLQNIQRELERVHQEMEQAQKDLTDVRADVPVSMARMSDFKQDLAAKNLALKVVFTACEDAWNNPLVTNNARSKRRNRTLRRDVKRRL